MNTFRYTSPPWKTLVEFGGPDVEIVVTNEQGIPREIAVVRGAATWPDGPMYEAPDQNYYEQRGNCSLVQNAADMYELLAAIEKHCEAVDGLNGAEHAAQGHALRRRMQSLLLKVVA